MKIPCEITALLNRLEQAGFFAYAVGGCIRDTLLGRTPNDWDVTTSARPEQVMALFEGFAIPTGLRHGTVTVRSDGMAVEVTTFRRETGYTDHRHPDAVAFSDTVEEDLQRRDFTVNAMAMDVRGTLIDPMGGQADLTAGILRCAGNPAERFFEDSLRMMRCLRFAAQLGFFIDADTSRQLVALKDDLRFVSAERLRDELYKLICAPHAAAILLQYPQVIGVILPEILPCVGFDQHNSHHCYTVWEHMVRSMEHIAPEVSLRLAMLLHDVGKPECFTITEDGVGHFYGHSARSAEIAADVCRRLRLDNDTAQRVTQLVYYHDRELLCNSVSIRRAMQKLGVDTLRQLLEVKRADTLALNPCYYDRLPEFDRMTALMDEALAQDDCFTRKQLAVTGRDLLDMGLRGPAVGQALQRLLDSVIAERLPNERQALLEQLRLWYG